MADPELVGVAVADFKFGAVQQDEVESVYVFLQISGNFIIKGEDLPKKFVFGQIGSAGDMEMGIVKPVNHRHVSEGELDKGNLDEFWAELAGDVVKRMSFGDVAQYSEEFRLAVFAKAVEDLKKNYVKDIEKLMIEVNDKMPEPMS